MSLQSNIVSTNSLDTITSSSMTIGTSASTIQLGGSGIVVIVGNIFNYGYISPGVLNVSTQTYTLSTSDLVNYQIIVPNYSSANPATVNDIITFTMPNPTSDMEGVIYTFRKIRGAISAGTTNLTFNWSGNYYIVNNTSLTTTGQPTNTFTTSAPLIRFICVGYLGVYYFILG
jgi:hypothetical protein